MFKNNFLYLFVFVKLIIYIMVVILFNYSLVIVKFKYIVNWSCKFVWLKKDNLNLLLIY